MTNKIKAFLICAALAATPMTAFAAEGSGIVESVDPVTRTVILQDGSIWIAAEGLEIEALMPGDKITVMYDDGTNTLTAVEKTE